MTALTSLRVDADVRWVLVDVDNVLIDGQLGLHLAKRLARGFRAVKSVAAMASAAVRYRAGKAPIGAVVTAACSLFEGELADATADRVRAAVADHIVPLVRPGMADWISRQVAAGRDVVLLSTGPHIAVQALAAALGATNGCGSDVEVTADGRLTATPIEPLCYGEGKVTVAMSMGNSLGLTLKEAMYLADSKSDLPLLRSVGFPVCANAKAEVIAHGTDAGWPIVEVR